MRCLVGYAGLSIFHSLVHIIMGLARPQRSSLQDDLSKYREIVRRSKELEKDIPPRLASVSRRKPTGKKRGSTKAKRGVKQEEGDQVKEEEHASEKIDEGIRLEGYIDRIRKVRPSMARPGTTRKKPMPVPTKDSASFLRTKATTFEHKVSVENSYENMVRMARGLCASGDIDLGLSFRLLPKLVDVERNRYQIPNPEADRLLAAVENRNAMISADLDDLFRKWSDLPCSSDQSMHSLPLI